MKKKIVIIIFISLYNMFIGQIMPSSEIKSTNVIPPSPTVSSLMKYEEIPVSNYTGVPDINIPLIKVNTPLKNVEMNISLKYHTNNLKIEEKAGNTGIGWSLFAGGTISRTVMDLPDELITYTVNTYPLSIGYKKKIGIYYDENSSPTNRNYVSKFINTASNSLDPLPYIEDFRTMFFESYYSNRYDTEYDIYQYNFLNYSGRFLLKKINHQLVVEKLDKNNLKISCFSSDNKPISFLIIDDYGNRFFFDVIETSSTSNFMNSTGLFNSTFTSATSDSPDFNSSYHLSTISDANNTPFVTLSYSENKEITFSKSTILDRSFTHNQLQENHNYINGTYTQFEAFLPKKNELIVSNIKTSTRQLEEIIITNYGKIQFLYEYGREDTNFATSGNNTLQNLAKLTNIKLISTSNQIVDDYMLNYDYENNHGKKRLRLTKLSKLKPNTNINILNYDFIYYPYLMEITEDDWKFNKCKKYYNDPYYFSYSQECITAGQLKSIIIPTKGKTSFEYEENTYTYVPEIGASNSVNATKILNFDKNELNWSVRNSSVTINTFDTTKYAFTLYDNNTVTIDINTSEINQYQWHLNILKNNSIQVAGFGTALLNNGDTVPNSITLDLQPGTYSFNLSKVGLGQTPTTFNTFFNIFYKERNLNNYQFLYGGGIRIKSIEYEDNIGGAPAKIINYKYFNPENTNESSGGLVFPEPVMSYKELFKTHFYYYSYISDIKYGNPFLSHDPYSDQITHTSNYNFLPLQKTKGADVGYQYVTIEEVGKGKTILQYTSPVDKPNPQTISTMPPFIPVPNFDFMRGNLVKKEIYDSNNKLVNQSKYTYSTQLFNYNYGIGLRYLENFNIGTFIYGSRFKDYNQFVQALNGYNNNPHDDIFPPGHPNPYPYYKPYLTTDSYNFIRAFLRNDVYGRTNLVQEENTEYYSPQKLLKTKIDYSYNVFDYPSIVTKTFPDNTLLETTYSYAHEKNNQYLIDKNMVGIPLVTTVIKKNDSMDTGKIISHVESKFPISQAEANMKTNGLVLPYDVWSKDIQNTSLHKEVSYDNYDDKGNLLQYTTKDGIPTTILWGYNKTQPIAKIVGATYRQVLTAMGIQEYETSQIYIKSNADNNQSTEDQLIDELDLFRKIPDLSGYQITTYTYDPLVGVRTITPPSGIREYYFYDTANRLEFIKTKDENGNFKILKEYKYNYKQ